MKYPSPIRDQVDFGNNSKGCKMQTGNILHNCAMQNVGGGWVK